MESTRQCIRCGNDFRPNKYAPQQRFCGKACQMAFWKLQNTNYCKHKDQQYYRNNKTKITAQAREWYQQNKGRVWEVRKASYRRHRAALSQGQLKAVLWNLQVALRRRFNRALHQDYKAGSAVRDLGCSIKQFKCYLESQFQPGMSWENYGQWHIDHIKPLALFDLTNPGQVQEACHFTNLRPLWAYINCGKGYEINKALSGLVKGGS